MRHERYLSVLSRLLPVVPTAEREVDAYGPIPTEAEIAAINLAAAEFLSGSKSIIVSSIFDDPLFAEFRDSEETRGALKCFSLPAAP